MNRKEAIKVLNELKQGIFPADMDIIIDALCLSVNALEEKRPHGEWIPVDIDEWVFRCSLCHNVSTFESKFCGNCGASMVKEGEAE